MEARLPTDTDRPLEENFQKSFKTRMCDSLMHSKDNLSTSQWLFLVSQTKYFAKTRRLAGSQLTGQRLDLTNDDDDAQNLSLILMLRDDDENQIIQVEII